MLRAFADLEAGSFQVARNALADLIRAHRASDDNQTAAVVSAAVAWWTAASIALPETVEDWSSAQDRNVLFDGVAGGGFARGSDDFASAVSLLLLAALSLTRPAAHEDFLFRSELAGELAVARRYPVGDPCRRACWWFINQRSTILPVKVEALAFGSAALMDELLSALVRSAVVPDNVRNRLRHRFGTSEEDFQALTSSFREHVLSGTYESAALHARLAAAIIFNRVLLGAPLLLWLRAFADEVEVLSAGRQEVHVVTPGESIESIIVDLQNELPFVTVANPRAISDHTLHATSQFIPRLSLPRDDWELAISPLVSVSDGIVISLEGEMSSHVARELQIIHRLNALDKTIVLAPDSGTIGGQELLSSARVVPISAHPRNSAIAGPRVANDVREAFGGAWRSLQDLRSISWKRRAGASR